MASQQSEATNPSKGPSSVLETTCRAAGAEVIRLWELAGPPDTDVAWIVAYQIDGGLCLVQTFEPDGWTALTDAPRNELSEVVADVLARCRASHGGSIPDGQ